MQGLNMLCNRDALSEIHEQTYIPPRSQIKRIIDIIHFQFAHIKYHDDKNLIHNDQIGLLMVK